MDKEELLQKRLKTVSEATGWDFDKAKQEMDKAAEMGIPNGKYVLHQAWMFSESELSELKEILDIQKAKQCENEIWHANVVSEKSGWPFEKSLEMLRIAKKKGYAYKMFVTNSFWRKTEEEINALPKYQKEVSEEKEADVESRRAKAREYRDIIMEEMGWSLPKTRLESLRARVLCGCTGIEFYLFGIYKNGIDEGNKFITAEYNARMKTRYCDWRAESLNYFKNKGTFNKEFKEFVTRKWFLNTEITFDEFKEIVNGLNKIIYKPIDGLEGRGIRIFSLPKDESALLDVYNEIINEPEGIVEEFIVQHPAISEIYPNAVNTIRVMSFLDNGKGKVLNAVMKFATYSNVDNYYQGGLAVGVDVETGVLCTDGVDYQGNIYKLHPYSNKELKGFKIPFWKELVAMIEEAAKVHPEQPYIGWDVSITPKGPEIVEGNNRQGAYLIQYPFAVCNHEGKRHTIEPYLWF